MEFNLVKIYESMGTFALLVAGALVVMALAALTVFFERLFVIGRSKARSRRFAQSAAPLLESSEHAKLQQTAEGERGSHLAMLLGAGMKTYLHALAHPGQLPAVELVRRELARRAEATEGDLKRGLGVLASVGSLAPFVGLLGTVVGIISAFEGIAKEGSGGLGAVSAGIAEALVVTALGLLVAIPAVLAFNFLTARIEAYLRTLDEARGELVDHLENVTPVAGQGARSGRVQAA